MPCQSPGKNPGLLSKINSKCRITTAGKAQDYVLKLSADIVKRSILRHANSEE
jgi:hypothetical protein